MRRPPVAQILSVLFFRTGRPFCAHPWEDRCVRPVPSRPARMQKNKPLEMEILRHFRAFVPPPAGAALTIGNFDGVHLGHRALVSRMKAAATARGLAAGVLTFEPHPARFLGGRAPPPLLSTRADKRRLLASLGLDFLVEQPFDAAWASLTPERFVTDVLQEGLSCRHLVVGYDFVFGARRAGNVDTLRGAAEAHGFTVEVVDALAPTGHAVASSTRIREAVKAGELALATALLGRPYHLHGHVVAGARRGRQLGFPTANLRGDNEVLPPPGVYAGWLDWGEGQRASAISVGDNPTFGDTGFTVEAHVLSEAITPGTNLYDRECHLSFAAWLRGQIRFTGPNALSDLVARIGADVDAARSLLATQTPPASLLLP
jgi:riboflavin kinase/FMN adenylyltransferase